MKQDRELRFWINNKMVGYIDNKERKLYGIGSDGFAHELEWPLGRDAGECLKEWRAKS